MAEARPGIAAQILGLPAWLLPGFATAGLGALASADAGYFYEQLVRPGWAPPGWLFAPVWSALYLLMGIAAWLVWRVRGFAAARTALSLYLVQLALNALWSWLFFVWHLGAAAFGDVALLGLLVLATCIAFWRVRPAAGALLVPYLAWVGFAGTLAWSAWKLNPRLLG